MENTMGGGCFRRLCDAAVGLSKADAFAKSAREWDVVNLEDAPGETCVCGHKDIRWCYRIRNRETGAELYPIGDKCIRRFGSKSMVRAATAFRDVYAIRIESARTIGTPMPIRRRDGSPLTRKGIDALLQAGALRPRPNDGLGGLSAQGAHDALLGEFNARGHDPARARTAYLVVERRVRPSLWEDFGIVGSKEPPAS